MYCVFVKILLQLITIKTFKYKTKCVLIVDKIENNDRYAKQKAALAKARETGANSRKGSVNKSTKAIKEMIEESLTAVGGAAYFQRQAEENPSAYMQLIGKVLPRTIDAVVDVTSTVKVSGDFLNDIVNNVKSRE